MNLASGTMTIPHIPDNIRMKAVVKFHQFS